MNKTEPKILAISKNQQCPGIFDPASIASQESGPVLVLESADILTKLSEKSMLLLDLALKIEARNNNIILTKLKPESSLLLELVAQNFSNYIREHTQDKLVIHIKPLYDQLDMLAKMRSRSALDILRSVLNLITLQDSNFANNFILGGVFSYDFLDHFEKLPEAKQDILALPDFLFYLPLTVVIIDHKNQLTSICNHELTNNINLLNSRALSTKNKIEEAIKSYQKPTRQIIIDNLDPASYIPDLADPVFGELVDTCKEHIKAGDVYQIVPSRTFSRPINNIIKSYKILRSLNPSPYMFYVQTDSWILFGASPETFIKVDKKGSRLSIRPIAGTRRRGLDPKGLIDEELDSREQASLCLDEKELAEHMMLVDLARNDIASISKPNSRRVRRLLGVDRFSHVMHLVSEVEGILRPGFDALSAYQASMNMGTLMGAPKVRAAELLRNLENSKRGFYGGAVGYINKLGDMDTSIIIRSAVVKNNQAYVRAGCGVVYDSDRNFEVRETINKAEAVLKAIDIADIASKR